MLTDALKKVHFIGIGGISLSSLALYLNENGVTVSGSDRSFSDKLVELNEKGCRVWVG
ncbi:MAG: Mur ligase domain-containing protein, partial [Christensenellales bacterium]